MPFSSNDYPPIPSCTVVAGHRLQHSLPTFRVLALPPVSNYYAVQLAITNTALHLSIRIYREVVNGIQLSPLVMGPSNPCPFSPCSLLHRSIRSHMPIGAMLQLARLDAGKWGGAGHVSRNMCLERDVGRSALVWNPYKDTYLFPVAPHTLSATRRSPIHLSKCQLHVGSSHAVLPNGCVYPAQRPR